MAEKADEKNGNSCIMNLGDILNLFKIKSIG
jgi:hypothetical protein